MISGKLQTVIILIFLLVNLAVKSSFLFKDFERIDAVAFPDDTYISLYIAKNIADGKGPFYTTGYTNGFQPLYVFLCVPFYLITSDKFTPIYLALILLIIFDSLSLFVLMKIGGLFSDNYIPAVITAVFWITSTYVTLTTLNGLETMISFFFILSTFYYFFKTRDEIKSDPRKLFYLGMHCGLAIFSRLDNVILAAVIFIFILMDFLKSNVNTKMIVKGLLIFTFSTGIVVLPWILYSYSYTGDFIQKSGEAVRYQNWSFFGHFSFLSEKHLEIIGYGFKTVFVKNFPLLLIIVACLILLAIQFKNLNKDHLKKQLHNILPVVLFTLLIFCSYVFYIYGMWFFKRYLFPVSFLFILLIIILTDNVIRTYIDIFPRRSRLIKAAFATVFMTAFVIINFTRYDFKKFVLEKDKETGYYAIGKWVSENFKDGTVIGSSQTGAMRYFADDLKVINLDGVVNKEALKYAKEKRIIEYIRENKIEYVVNWNINHDYIVAESANLKNDDIQKSFEITEFKTYSWPWSVYKINYSISHEPSR